jgi:hypothetical protein
VRLANFRATGQRPVAVPAPSPPCADNEHYVKLRFQVSLKLAPNGAAGPTSVRQTGILAADVSLNLVRGGRMSRSIWSPGQELRHRDHHHQPVGIQQPVRLPLVACLLQPPGAEHYQPRQVPLAILIVSHEAGR